MSVGWLLGAEGAPSESAAPGHSGELAEAQFQLKILEDISGASPVASTADGWQFD